MLYFREHYSRKENCISLTEHRFSMKCIETGVVLDSIVLKLESVLKDSFPELVPFLFHIVFTTLFACDLVNYVS